MEVAPRHQARVAHVRKLPLLPGGQALDAVLRQREADEEANALMPFDATELGHARV